LLQTAEKNHIQLLCKRICYLYDMIIELKKNNVFFGHLIRS